MKNLDGSSMIKILDKYFGFKSVEDDDFGTHSDLETKFKDLRKKYVDMDEKMNKTDDKLMNKCVQELKRGFFKKVIKLKK